MKSRIPGSNFSFLIIAATVLPRATTNPRATPHHHPNQPATIGIKTVPYSKCNSARQDSVQRSNPPLQQERRNQAKEKGTDTGSIRRSSEFTDKAKVIVDSRVDSVIRFVLAAEGEAQPKKQERKTKRASVCLSHTNTSVSPLWRSCGRVAVAIAARQATLNRHTAAAPGQPAASGPTTRTSRSFDWTR
jgi:hypothetical protein